MLDKEPDCDCPPCYGPSPYTLIKRSCASAGSGRSTDTVMMECDTVDVTPIGLLFF